MESSDFFVGMAQQALWITALAAAPILIPALLAGLLLGMIQAATSINEQTLTFVPKIAAIMIVLMLLIGWMFTSLGGYTTALFELIPDMAR